MYVLIIGISCLYRVDVILSIRYSKLWWSIRKEYCKYTVFRSTFNNHESMANIISKGGEGIWR